MAGGTLLDDSVVAGDAPAVREPIRLRFAQVERILGMAVPADECVSILKNLGLECVEQSSESASFTAPSWRLDLTRECDLIEEVARIHVYDRIPDNATLPVVDTAKSRREAVGDALRNLLSSAGFFEALTLSFVSEEQQRLFRPRGEVD